MLTQDLINYLFAWLGSRKWKRLLLFVLPTAVILLLATGLVVLGFSQNEQDLMRSYLEMAEAQLNVEEEATAEDGDTTGASNATGEADMKSRTEELVGESESVSDFGRLLFRRVLQIEEFNPRATFLVALDMDRRGQSGAARQLMRKIAPVSGDNTSEEGYSAAHAWLAADRVIRRQPIDATLLRDLEIASRWEAVSSGLLRAYSSVLVNSLQDKGRLGQLSGEDKSRIRDTIDVLQRKSEDEPELKLAVVELSALIGNKRDFDTATEESKQILSGKVQSGTASPTDYANLSRMHVLSGEFETAIRVGELGLRVSNLEEQTSENPNASRAIRRVLSEAYRLAFRASISESDKGLTLNLELLNKALEVDPTNPQVARDVDLMLTSGNATPEMKAMLEEKIADGSASAVASLMYANNLLATAASNQDGDVDAESAGAAKAVPHLELALARAPNNPVIMNNLAFALVKADTSNVDRALELIDRAIAIGGQDASQYASMYDTKGQILQMHGDYTDAIACYQDAIRTQPTKVATRARLAEAFEAAGMPEMAAIQRKRVKELENPNTE